MSDFQSLANTIFPGYNKIIIAGDFNLPNISWADSTYTLVGSLSQKYCDILDLIITNQPELVTLTEICSLTQLGMSTDHNIVQFHFSYGYNTIQPIRRLIHGYRRANFDGLRKRLTDMDLRSLLKNNGIERSINDDWSTWKTALMTAINEFIPTVRRLSSHSRLGLLKTSYT